MTLKELRESQGLPQWEFGEIVGRSRDLICDYEKGRRKIPDEEYERIKEHFHVDIRPENVPARMDGSVLRTIRIAHDISQRQMARILGIGTTSIRRYEEGKLKVPSYVVDRLERWLEQPIEEKKRMDGATLKAIRLAHGLTAMQMGKIIGKSPSIVLSYEKGRYKMQLDAIERLEKWMETSPSVEEKKEMDGATLKSIRIAHGLSKRALGKIIERSPSTILFYEEGKTKMPPEVVMRVEEWLANQGPASSIKPQEETPSAEVPTEEEEKRVNVFIQSQSGSTISVEEVIHHIRGVIPSVDNIYVKPEENRAYWTAGRFKGSMELWFLPRV